MCRHVLECVVAILSGFDRNGTVVLANVDVVTVGNGVVVHCQRCLSIFNGDFRLDLFAGVLLIRNIGNGGGNCFRGDCPVQGNVARAAVCPRGFGFVVQRSSCFIATSVGSGGLTLNRVVIAVAASNGKRLLSSIINIGTGRFGLLDDLCRNRKILGIGGHSAIGNLDRLLVVRSDGKLIACFRLSCVSSQLFCLVAGIGGRDDHAGQIQLFTAEILQLRLRCNFDFRQRVCCNVDRNITGVGDAFILIRSRYHVLTLSECILKSYGGHVYYHRCTACINERAGQLLGYVGFGVRSVDCCV